MRPIRLVVFAVCLAAASHTAEAQTQAPASDAGQDWQITVYPLLAWIPFNIAIDANVPPVNGDGGGSGFWRSGSRVA